MISEYVNTRLNQIEKEDEDDATKYVVKGAKLLNAATGVIERNLFSPELGVGLLCKELNMGKTNLTKRLKDASEMTPRAFIEDIKLKHAAQMLSDGVYRIAEIAGLLDFSSPKYFTQRFSYADHYSFPKALVRKGRIDESRPVMEESRGASLGPISLPFNA